VTPYILCDTMSLQHNIFESFPGLL